MYYVHLVDLRRIARMYFKILAGWSRSRATTPRRGLVREDGTFAMIEITLA